MRRRRARYRCIARAVALAAALGGCADDGPGGVTAPPLPDSTATLDARLRGYLALHGFTGRVGTTLEARLGRRVEPALADVGRLLWFDPIQGLNDDNTCAGCHSPTHGFGDTQPIAIGIDNNGVVGAGREGPRNQRRSPMVVNTAFYPTLMWNSRFRAGSGDPFDYRRGFSLALPEGTIRSFLPHLLTAQAFVPPTERVEAAGFHFPGDGEAIRDEVAARVDAVAEYRRRFAAVVPRVRAGGRVTYGDIANALAEFQFTQVYADAPIDRYARGDRDALDPAQKRGAVLFFGRAGCVRCHAVGGGANEMFSDFREHVAGIPQVVPARANMTFDGPGADEDFGLAQVTGLEADRYAFRTSPLRNVALQPAFMHNGAFVQLEDAVRHHLDAVRGAATYRPDALPPDLRGAMGPIDPVLARLDPLLREPVTLTDAEFADLIAFVRDGLLDPRATPGRLRALIPAQLPSGRTPLRFP